MLGQRSSRVSPIQTTGLNLLFALSQVTIGGASYMSASQTQTECPGFSQVTAFWDIFLVFHIFCSFLLESHPFQARARVLIP